MGDLAERKFGDLTVRIDRGLCIGSGNCLKVAPEVFEFEGENIASFKQDAKDVGREEVMEACDVCPVDALIVIDADGKQLIPGNEG